MNIVFLVLFLIVIFVFFVVFGLLPSIINLVLTYFCVLPIWKKTKSLLLVIPLFVLLSFVLGVNTRLIGVIDDLSSSPIINVASDHKLELTHGSKVALKGNTDLISYKKLPLKNPELGGDEGCMCTYYNNPKIIHENFLKELTNLGLTVVNKAETTITINNTSDEYLLYLSVEIKHLGKEIAARSFRIRKKYSGDLPLNTKSRTKDGGLLFHLSKNNFWKSLLESSSSFKEQDNVVMNFITKHVSVVSSMENLETSDAIPLNQIDFQNNFKLSRGKIGDIIQCDEFFVYDDYKIYRGIHIKQDNMAIPVEGSRHLSIEKTLCFETRIYIVTTPNKHKEEFIIKAFDYEGRNTEHLKFLVPSRKWQGVPRKPLIYFNPSINKIDIGIQEFGREMDEVKNLYYRLPLASKMQNNQAGISVTD